ncbi:MAG: amino acid ABC transporter substrate-binding protein, partial [Candidatus Methanomethylicia archaeon]
MYSRAVSKTIAIIIAVIVVIAIIAAAAMVMTPPTPSPTSPSPKPTPTTPTTPTTPPTPTPTTPTPTTPTTPIEEIPSEIRIGVAIQLSGAQVVEGAASFRGIQCAVKWINDHGGVNFKGRKVPLKLIYYDCESKRDYAVKLVEKLITEDKVHIVIHPYASTFVMATAPVTEKYKMFSINFGGSSDALYQQGFKYMVSTHGFAVIHYWQTPFTMIKEVDPGAKKVAIIFKDDEWGRSLGESARIKTKNFGFEVVYDRSYPPDITDATPMLREIAALKPDILCVGGHYKDGYLIATQLRDLRINIKWVIIQVTVAKPEFSDLGKWAVGFMGETTWEPECKWDVIAAKEGKEYYGPTSDELVKLYYELGGTGRPSAYTGYGAISVLVAAKCIETAQSLNPDKLIQAAKQLDFYCVKSRFKVDPENPAKQIGSINPVVQWQRGEGNKLVYAVIYPFEFATSNPIPMPTWE